jgi:type IV pilus assembly protein PilA
MNKKGFTLVELLGVIVILALIALISVPVVNNIIKKSQKQIKDSNISTILDAAYAYSLDDDINLALPTTNNSSITVSLDTLKKSGHLKKEVKNADTGLAYANTCLVTITKKSYDSSEADANENDPNKKYYGDYLFSFGC